MRSSKRVVRNVLVGALVLAMGVATFANANSSYAAGEAKLNKTSRNILARKSYDFDVTGAPADAVITWSSSDEKIATVDENGVVTGVKKGEATITCEITSAGETKKLTAEVKIRKPAVKIVINNKVSELEYGKKVDLNRTLTPKTSNDVTTWKSSNTKIATVDSNGVVTALSDGTVTITATTMSGKTDSVDITVYGSPAPTQTPGTETKPTTTPAKPTPKPTATPTPAKKNLVYNFADMTDKGYGYTAKKADGAVTVEYSDKWKEIQYALPEAVDLSKYDTMIVTLATKSADSADAVAFKLAAVGAANDQYGNPDSFKVQYDVTSAKKGEITVDLSEFSSQKLNHIGIMANNAATTTTLYKVEFVLKDGVAAEEPAKPQEITYEFASLTEKGYGYTAEKADGAVTVEYSDKWQEIQYALPEAVDLSVYDTMVVTLATKSANSADAVAFKLAAVGAANDQYGNPDSFKVQYDVTSAKKGEITVDLSEFSSQKLNHIGIMANNAATTTTLYSVTFIPKK